MKPAQLLLFATALLTAAGVCPAQLVFSEFLPSGNMRVLQESGGQVTVISTGTSATNFAGLSRDGRFLTFSEPDPVPAGGGPVPSSDLYRFDRNTGTRELLLDQQTTQLAPSGNPPVTRWGSFVPVFSQQSPDGSAVVFTNQLTARAGLAEPETSRNLNVQPTNGGQGTTIETGSGAALDLLRAEFVGIGFAPDGSFATSAYITVNSPIGPRPAQGIVRYAPVGQNGAYVRVANLSTPTLTTQGVGLASTVQVFPAFSPSGNGLAYFDLSYPDSALLTQPVTARLIVANGDGSNARIVTPFNPGFFPVGLSWSGDGNSLVFSIGQQGFSGGIYGPFAEPSTAVVRQVATGGNGSPTTIAGVGSGLLPFYPLTGGGGGGPIELADVTLSLTATSGGALLLRAGAGLDPGANYVLESSSGLGGFGAPATFTGQQLMSGGISITPNSPANFFRVREP